MRKTIFQWREKTYVLPKIAEMSQVTHPVAIRLPDGTLLSVVNTRIPPFGHYIANVVEVTVLDAKPFESD